MASKEKLIVAVVSGKGGVGKTVVSTAISYEFSKTRPTLLIDLDFFNRGLSGLMKGGVEVKEIEPPEAFAAQESKPPKSDVEMEEIEPPEAFAAQESKPPKSDVEMEEIEPPEAFAAQESKPPKSDVEMEEIEPEQNWIITRMGNNIFTLKYSDPSSDLLLKFQSGEIDKLKQYLKELVDDVAMVCKAEVVVLDCHGGPDNTSFAACAIAKYSVLVSEPDPVTFSGTLHFLRQAKKGNR